MSGGGRLHLFDLDDVPQRYEPVPISQVIACSPGAEDVDRKVLNEHWRGIGDIEGLASGEGKAERQKWLSLQQRV
jgi:hypothetical protein